ncbi:MAG: SpoIIIAH-like family protein [Oscillospiraceae bacterium]|jgi:stage III sporulation protein AH|nr:SpoIIIAH-like family protein [Oscillospiraceae bacterium]
MTHNLFTVRQPSAALTEPVEYVRPPKPVRTAQPAQSKSTAQPARLRGPLTLLTFSPKAPRLAKPSKPARAAKTIMSAKPTEPAKPTILPDAPSPKTAPSRSRLAAMSGLCLLLIASGAWAAMTKPISSIVGIPVTIRQNVPEASPTTTPGPAVSPTAAPEPGGAGETTLTTLSSFLTYKQQMDAAREQSITMLDALIADVNADAATLEQARGEKLTLAKSISTEATLQSLMAARGFGDSYITVRPGSVNVVVRQDKLTSQQMASILEMVTAETGESPDNVKIVLTK